MIPWLENGAPFPPLKQALREPNGLLAAGGDLSPERLLAAYQHGIFPWFSDDQPILWWSPDPRMVLFPQEFRLAKSLQKRLKRNEFLVSTDTAFSKVMQACAQTKREGQPGTWISQEIIDGYTRLHELGVAHSVEAWELTPEDESAPKLVGGLYGVAIGRMFYGESMFSHRTDASKAAFAHLLRYLQTANFGLLDCQMKTAHLASLGAREIGRTEFIEQLNQLTAAPSPAWPSGSLSFLW